MFPATIVFSIVTKPESLTIPPPSPPPKLFLLVVTLRLTVLFVIWAVPSITATPPPEEPGETSFSKIVLL